jgi:hypothetical protein
MAFKENLKKKILTNRLSRTVCQSIGSPDSTRKIDKESMRKVPLFSRKEETWNSISESSNLGLEKS